jgi:SCY1-like protein 2
MLGSWWFGGPSSPDSNYLRVANAFPNRRLSDNTLMTPKIRIAPSCASSPGNSFFYLDLLISFFSLILFLLNFHVTNLLGGTPGGGLPIRRHSSIGPQGKIQIKHFFTIIRF